MESHQQGFAIMRCTLALLQHLLITLGPYRTMNREYEYLAHTLYFVGLIFPNDAHRLESPPATVADERCWSTLVSLLVLVFIVGF